MAQDNHFGTDETGGFMNSDNSDNYSYNRGGQMEGGDSGGGGGIVEDSIENQLFPDLPFPDQSYFSMNSTPSTSQTSLPPAPAASTAMVPAAENHDDAFNNRGSHRGQALVSNESLASFTAAAEPLTSQLSSSDTAAMAPPLPPFPSLPPPSAAATAAAAAVAAAATASATSSSTTGMVEPNLCGSSSLILDGTTLHVANIGPDGNPPSGSPTPTATNTVPEFLYQLTKMLTDNNREIIEWSKGKIEVHSPHKLETHVLNRYFRHSKFASFQRQLNYFGFRKQAGKGKMAPCSYVNDDTTDELASLLNIKRKPGGEGNPKRGGKKREREDGNDDKKGNRGRSQSDQDAGASATSVVNPVLAGILHKSGSGGLTGVLSPSTSGNDLQTSGSARAVNPTQRDIARVAVGRGIRHGLTKSQIQAHPRATAVQSSSSTLGHSSSGSQVVGSSPVQEGLDALTSNFRNSLNDLPQAAGTSHGQVPQQPSSGTAASRNRGYIPGSLRRDDSLVDLAMIPTVDETGHDSNANPSAAGNSSGFDFVDFPFDTDFFNDHS